MLKTDKIRRFSVIILVVIFFLLNTGMALSEGFIGEIRIIADANNIPRGWALCNGQILAISQNTALFSLIGTIYGGDGRYTFALPDLRGRTPIHSGQGPGLTNRRLGEKGGQETVALTVNQLPPHSHDATINASDNIGTSASPTENYWAATGDNSANYYYYYGEYYKMSSSGINIGSTGGGQPHKNMPPYLVVKYIICIQGLYPSR